MPLSDDLTFTVDSQTIFVVVVVLDLGKKKKKVSATLIYVEMHILVVLFSKLKLL